MEKGGQAWRNIENKSHIWIIWKDGVKIKNAGFVRIEEQNGHNRMEVKVKNLPGKTAGRFPVTGRTIERTVGRISLQGGNGNCCMVWRMPEPGELDNSREESWQQTAQLRILLSGKRMLIANWHEPVEISGTERDAAAAAAIAGTRGSVPTDGGAVIADKFTPAARSWRNYSVSRSGAAARWKSSPHRRSLPK